jgi:hypothetical protein
LGSRPIINSSRRCRASARSVFSLLVAAPRRGLGRLGEMRRCPDRLQLLHDEAPARRRLQRHLERLAGEAR